MIKTKLTVKKWIVWLVLALVLAGMAYMIALKFEALKFAVLHTQETVYASARYNDVQKAANEMYKEAFSSPISK